MKRTPILKAAISFLFAATSLCPAMADNCYVNDVGNAIVIQDKDDGRSTVIFDLGEDGFTAEGPRLTSIVLTQYIGSDKERFAEHINGPEVAVEFSKDLAKVKTSKNSPWNIDGIKGDYFRLDLPKMLEKLRGDARFTECEKKMEEAFKALLDATPEEQKNDIVLAQKEWQEEIAEKMALDVLLDSDLIDQENHKVSQAIPDAYLDVIRARTRWLEILTKQQRDPNYAATFTGTLYKMDRGGAGINIMLRADGQYSNIFLCAADTVECTQADNLLAEKDSTYAKATGRLDTIKGFKQDGKAIPVKAATRPVDKPLTKEQEKPTSTP